MSFFKNIVSKIFPPSHPAVAAAVAPSAPVTAPPVDIDAVVTALAQKKTERLNWRTSIVDLLKVLDLDSSLASRKELAADLGYTGSTEDSAAMNIWLHAQVMKRLAENGGVLPKDMKAA